MEIQIIPMQPHHTAQIAALERTCFSDPWPEQIIVHELENELSLWLCALDGDTVAGYIGSQTVLGEADMMNVAVSPAYRRQGIGRALVLKVTDVMRTGARVAAVAPATTVLDTLLAMTKAQAGSAVVVDAEGKLEGIFTDGDFRRHVSEGREVLGDAVSRHMTRHPLTIGGDAYAVDLLRVFESRQIDDLPVCAADGRLLGVVDIQDLPKMKVL